MSKAIDRTAATLLTFLLFLIWLYLLTESFVGALVLSALITLTLFIVLSKTLEKRAAHYPKEKLYNTLALLGNGYVLSLYQKAEVVDGDICGSAFLYSDTTVFSAFRFSAATADDVAAAYRTALEFKSSKVVFICKKAPREVMVLANSLPVSFEFVFAPQLFKLFKLKNLLPDDVNFKQREVKLPSLKNLFDSATSDSNVRYYVFSGAVLALMVFVTPMKLYYVIMSSISLILAIICKIRA